MSDDQAELGRWRAYFHYDPDLEPWVHELSALLDVRDRLDAALNFVQALDPGDDADKRLGVAIAALAFAFVDKVYQHLNVGCEPLAHAPRNLALALIALRNVLTDAGQRVTVKRMQLVQQDGPDEDTLAPAEAEATADVPAPKRRKREEIPDDYEANIRIKKYLDSHPKATIKDVAEAVGLSPGKVCKLDAWRQEMGRRQAQKEPPRKGERPLTPKMLAAIGKEDDVAARLDAEDAIWQRLLEQAAPAERAKLHAMRPQERRKLIEAARDQYADELADERS